MGQYLCCSPCTHIHWESRGCSLLRGDFRLANVFITEANQSMNEQQTRLISVEKELGHLCAKIQLSKYCSSVTLSGSLMEHQQFSRWSRKKKGSILPVQWSLLFLWRCGSFSTWLDNLFSHRKIGIPGLHCGDQRVQRTVRNPDRSNRRDYSPEESHRSTTHYITNVSWMQYALMHTWPLPGRCCGSQVS